MGTDARQLIDRFCDGVPRSSADPLDLGPFTVVFLSAADAAVAPYARLGFGPIGTACLARVAGDGP